MGCGAWTAPLLLLGYLAPASTFTWSVAFYALAIVFNYPHYMATLYRAYHTAEDFQKYRIFTVHITLLIVLTALITHFSPRLLPWIFTLYLTWSPWHYSGQNYGILMLFARRAGVQLSGVQRWSLHSAFLLSYAILFVSFHTGASTDPLFVSLNIPSVLGADLRILLFVVFVVCAGIGLGAVVRQTGFRAALPPLTIFSTQFLWFLLPSVLQLSRGMQIPQSRYSTGLLAVMHSAQYLWITSYYAKREATAGQKSDWKPFAYFGILVLGGIALFVPGPWIASRVFHFDFTASFLIFTALVNIHHFILDGAIWKLRDGRIAALLLSPQRSAVEGARAAGDGILSAARWIGGSTTAARAIRITAGIALLAIAGVDQYRYVKAVHEDDPAAMQTAAELDPYDATLQMRIARKGFQTGEYAKAEEAWNSAIVADRSNPAPRTALLKMMLLQGRFEPAYKLASESATLFPADAEWQINYGIIANKLGKTGEAKVAWEQAVQDDPTNPSAHLYLAQMLQADDPRAAMPHYAAYLELITKSADPTLSAPDKVIPVLLQLGECQGKVGDLAHAERSFELAQRMAQRANLTDLQSMAFMADAQSKSARRRFAEALPLYQSALRLDDASLHAKDISPSVFRGAALDWYNYGIALRDNGIDPTLAYACLVQSSELFKTLPLSPENAQQSEVVNKAIHELERKVGLSAAKARKELRENLLKAMAVKD